MFGDGSRSHLHEDIDMVKKMECRCCILLIAITLLTTMTGCDFGAPVKVGFSGQMTGPHGNMGVSGRDGLVLAINEINAAGGVAGKKVVLQVCDDKGTPEGARAAAQELIKAGVVAIIGHMTSEQTMAALPVVEEAGVVLLSPTASTAALTGKVDHFFRVISDSTPDAVLLVRHVVQERGLKRLAAIYDQENAAFSNTYLKAFKGELEKQGGQLVAEVGYTSSEKPLFGPLLTKLRSAEPEGLVIISSAYDGALIAQQQRILGWHINLFGSGWTLSAPLIENGGRAVEGMEFVHYFDRNSENPNFIAFQENYLKQFKQWPSFMAVNAYESMLVLAEALKRTGARAEGLTRAMPGISINGLAQPVSLDQYGDGVRDRYRFTVQDGTFVTTGQVSL